MRKLWLIIKREYVTRVWTKTFILTTIGLPLFSVGIFAFSIFMATRQGDYTLAIAVLDEVGGLATSIAPEAKEKLPNGLPPFQVVRTIEPANLGPKTRAQLAEDVRQKRLDGYLVLPKDVLEGKAAEFHTMNPGDMRLTATLNQAISDAVIARRLSARGLHLANARAVVRGVDLKVVKVTRLGETEERGQTFLTAIIIGMLLYISLLVYGIATMRAVLEEKSTRVIEILVSSVQSFQLLMGKILGVAAVGFTQFLIWTITGGLLAGYGAAMARAFLPNASAPQIHLPVSVLIYTLVFFLSGYFLYASLYAAVGAIVSDEQEGQQISTPLTLLIVASFIMFNVILRDSNSTTSIVLSMIPFFAPILMVLRITIQTPPFWQILLSIAIQVLTTLVLVKFSAKIYRVGILMYGKRPSLVELFRWLRYA
jgi:ABC-2 type transport system permease protein